MRAAITPQRLAAIFLPVILMACPRPHVELGKDGAPTSAEELLKRVVVAESQIVSIKGDARLGVDSPQGKGSVTLFAAVMHPAFVHIEQVDFFGRPQGVFVTDGERFGLYSAQDAKYYRGPATAANLARFLPLVMPPRELASIMLGRAPKLSADSLEMRFDDAQQLFVLTLKRGAAKQTLFIQPPSYRVVKSTAENLNAYALAFADLTTVGPVTLPKLATLDAERAKTKLELVWKDVELNAAPDLTLFEMTPPEDIPVVEVDGNGDPRQPAEQP